jgi:hypothetical protein
MKSLGRPTIGQIIFETSLNPSGASDDNWCKTDKI